MNVNTKLGNIYAESRGDDYPGIVVGLERNGVKYSFAWVEVDQSDAEPIMKVHAFNDRYDSPVFNINITAERLARLFNDGPDFGEHKTYGEEN